MFGQAAAAAIQAKKDAEDADQGEAAENEEDQPPKVEVKVVQEEDSIHSVR